MKGIMTVIQSLLLLGVAQGILLGAVLWTTKRGPKTANRMLGSIVLIFAVSILLHALGHGRSSLDLKYHDSILHLGFLVINPLLFFYVRALTAQGFRWTMLEFLHFTPVVIGFVLLVLNTPVNFMNYQLLTELIGTSIGVQAVFYIILSYRRLRRHSQMIANTFSSIERMNLQWIRFLLGMFSLVWIFALAMEISKNELFMMDLFWLFMSLFIYLMGYFGLRQPEIFTGIPQLDQPPEPAGKRKYEKSTLTFQKSEEYLQQLQQVMKMEKPYIERDITLPALAAKLALTTHELSQLINERLNKNFFEFINTYRVDEAKVMMADRRFIHLSIAAIGYEAGFNSVSAFNAAFKKHAGIIPSQYRQTCLSEMQSSPKL